MELNKMWDYLIDEGIATEEEELQLITYINGYNIEALNAVLYVRTGYNDIERLTEELADE